MSQGLTLDNSEVGCWKCSPPRYAPWITLKQPTAIGCWRWDSWGKVAPPNIFDIFVCFCIILNSVLPLMAWDVGELHPEVLTQRNWRRDPEVFDYRFAVSFFAAWTQVGWSMARRGLPRNPRRRVSTGFIANHTVSLHPTTGLRSPMIFVVANMLNSHIYIIIYIYIFAFITYIIYLIATHIAAQYRLVSVYIVNPNMPMLSGR